MRIWLGGQKIRDRVIFSRDLANDISFSHELLKDW
jgi:hypothetical protein